jgi:hypothetical protein
MKTLLFFSCIFCFVFNQTIAQSLSPAVLSSSGAFYSNSSMMLSSTIGELAMVETFSAGGTILNQGFQQTFDFTNGILELHSNGEVILFPNPTTGNFNIQLPSSFNGECYANMYDAIGRIVFHRKIPVTLQAGILSLSMEELANGMYLFELKTNSENYFSKINLIK